MVLCIDHIKHLCFSDVDDVGNLNDDDSSDSEEENDQMQDLPPKKKKCTYRWRKNNPPVHDITFLGDDFSLPPVDEQSPIDYFKIFWDDGITENLAEQTNIYSVQNS